MDGPYTNGCSIDGNKCYYANSTINRIEHGI